MTINKFQGKTKEEAIEKARAEFGPSAVIMNVKEIKPKGLLGIFSATTYEVTAAIEEKEPVYTPTPSAMTAHAKVRENINLAADEEIAIPQPMRTPAREEVKKAVFEEKEEIVVDRVSKFAKLNPIDSDDTNYDTEKQFKERLDNLSELLEQKLSGQVRRKRFAKLLQKNLILFV